jgi:hypothetical protein
MKNVFSRDMIQDRWYQCVLYQFSYQCVCVCVCIHIYTNTHVYMYIHTYRRYQRDFCSVCTHRYWCLINARGADAPVHFDF